MCRLVPTIPVARPWLDEREAEAARRAILSGWVTQGPEVAAFEREFAAAVGAPHACAVSSCTTALHLALVALGVGPGDEVVTVSHSFIATANAVRYCGALPVFVDIEPDTFNIDPAPRRRRRARTAPRRSWSCTSWACRATWPSWCRWRGSRGVPVIEDAACAIGSEVRWQGEWQRIGRPHGDVACFSFHPRKLLSTGDGGMLTTARADLDARFRLLRQHGMSVPDTVRHASTRGGVRVLSGARLQLPDDRHPGGDRARAAQPAGRRSWRGGASWRRATRARWPACPGVVDAA